MKICISSDTKPNIMLEKYPGDLPHLVAKKALPDGGGDGGGDEQRVAGQTQLQDVPHAHAPQT